MSDLTHIMLCEHKRLKRKMVIHATRSRLGHFQGYKMTTCCVKCGQAVLFSRGKTLTSH